MGEPCPANVVKLAFRLEIADFRLWNMDRQDEQDIRDREEITTEYMEYTEEDGKEYQAGPITISSGADKPETMAGLAHEGEPVTVAP